MVLLCLNQPVCQGKRCLNKLGFYPFEQENIKKIPGVVLGSPQEVRNTYKIYTCIWCPFRHVWLSTILWASFLAPRLIYLRIFFHRIVFASFIQGRPSGVFSTFPIHTGLGLECKTWSLMFIDNLYTHSRPNLDCIQLTCQHVFGI